MMKHQSVPTHSNAVNHRREARTLSSEYSCTETLLMQFSRLIFIFGENSFSANNKFCLADYHLRLEM